MEVSTRFESFPQFQEALEELKRNGSHPLRVYNSQSAEDYNKKRVSKKFFTERVDAEKIKYTYYSVRCVHYGDTRHRGNGIRPNQQSFSLGCKAKITISYDRYRALYH